MDREKAIKILRNEIECLSHSKCSDCPLDKVCDQLRTPLDSEYIEAYGMAIEALSTSEIPNKWIPVSERLPEDSYAVLVWCPERRNIYCANREKDQWWIFGTYHTVSEDVDAWVPLPEPYLSENPTGSESEDTE